MNTPTETPTFRPPASIQAAKARRAELIQQMLAIQTLLRGPAGWVGGRRVAPGEYQSWRAGVLAELEAKQSESVALKRWVADEYQSRRRDVLDATGRDDPKSRMKAAREATANLCRVVGELEDEVLHLRAENAALRSQLAALRPAPVAATTATGHDEWRDE